MTTPARGGIKINTVSEEVLEDAVWLTAEEVARIVRRSEQAVYSAIDRGTLKHEVVHRTRNGRQFYRIHRDWVDEWLAEKEENQRRGKRKQQSESRGRQELATAHA